MRKILAFSVRLSPQGTGLSCALRHFSRRSPPLLAFRGGIKLFRRIYIAQRGASSNRLTLYRPLPKTQAFPT